MSEHNTVENGDALIERMRLTYRIGELTGANHRAFVEQAFRALLKRQPTPVECEAMLALLAAGATKAEALGNLRWSAEGRAIGTRVAGLASRYAMAKLRRVPLLGLLFDIPLHVAALPALARHLRASDAAFAAHADAHAAHVAHAEATTRENAAQFAAAEARAALAQRRLDEIGHELAFARDGLARSIDALDAGLRVHIDALAQADQTHEARFAEFEFIRQRFYAVNHWMHHLNEAFARIEGAAKQGNDERRRQAWPVAQACVAADAARAARNAAWAGALHARLAVPAAQVFAGACGADWVTTLAAQGCRVIFADADAAFAGIERGAGIDVEAVDAFESLRRCADASLDGAAFLATSSLLRARSLLDWLFEARRALKPGAPLLLAAAREPGAIVDALTQAAATPDIDAAALQPALFAATGFVDVQRIDAADGTPAWLMRLAAA